MSPEKFNFFAAFAEAQVRLAEFGRNELEEKANPKWKLLLKHCAFPRRWAARSPVERCAFRLRQRFTAARAVLASDRPV